MNHVAMGFKKLFNTSGWLFRRPLHIYFFIPKRIDKAFRNIGRPSALRKQKSKKNSELNDLFSSMDEVIFSVDMIALKVIHITNSCEKLYGYGPDFFLKDHLFWFKIVHPDDKHILENEGSILRSGEHINNQYRIIRKDKDIRWVESKIIPILDKKGRLIKVNGITRDITERRLSEIELDKNKEKYRQIVETTQEGIWMIDKFNNTSFVNKKMCEIIEYTTGELMEGKIYDFMDKESREDVLRHIEKRKQGINENHDSRFITKSGKVVWVNISANPVLDDEGNYNGTLKMMTNVTERKQLEENLEREKYFLDALMDNMPEAIYFKDKESKLLRVSKFMADRFGVPMGSLIGMSDFDFQNEIHAKEAYEDEQNIQKTGKPKVDYEEKEIGADGSESWVSTTKMPLINTRGEVVGTFGISRDITSRKLGEESLKRSEANLEIKNKELEQKNKELEQFAYVASHDLQEPLRTTASFVEILLEQYSGKLDERADKYLTYIRQSSDRMRTLIEDLLDYSRIGYKKEFKKADCNVILSEVLGDIDTIIKESQARIEADVLPIISCYSTEIKQLFQNLLINAIKFRKKDTTPYIKISTKNNKGYWQFAFEDNGIGIEEQYKERVFIIFQRLHTRNEYEGSGIGLSHCKKIVELHGGKIWIESIPCTGTTFYFTIPENTNL